MLIIITSCSSQPERASWSNLPAGPAEAQMDMLTPTWEQGTSQDSLDIRIYLQPAQKSIYMQDTLSYLISLSDARVRIYDYPAKAEVEGIMLAGIGECIAEEDPSKYLQFLQIVAASNENVQDELVMAAIAKQVLGENYSRTCLQKKIKGLKEVFENENPLMLTSTPATVINGRILYGDLGIDAWKGLMTDVEMN